jgi:hypothetical protein
MSKLFLAALLFIAVPIHAFNEPDSFMGLKFWRPVSEGSLPECPDWKEALRERPAVKDDHLEKLLAERQERLEEFNRKRALYSQGKATRAEVTEAEKALASSVISIDEAKRRVSESNMPPLFERGKPCWEKIGSDGNTHNINNVAIGGFILDVKAESLQGKLAHIFIVFPQGDYGTIFLTFKERYGAPTSAKTETVQSRIGAKFKNEIFKWEGKRLTITLDKMGWTVDKGTVSYDTDIWRAYSAKKFQQDIKQKAKGL